MSELPYQQTYGEMKEHLETTLTDLDFLEAKCTAGMTYDLVTDYDRLGVGRAQAGPPIRTAWVHEGKHGVMCPFCARMERDSRGTTWQGNSLPIM